MAVTLMVRRITLVRIILDAIKLPVSLPPDPCAQKEDYVGFGNRTTKLKVVTRIAVVADGVGVLKKAVASTMAVEIA